MGKARHDRRDRPRSLEVAFKANGQGCATVKPESAWRPLAGLPPPASQAKTCQNANARLKPGAQSFAAAAPTSVHAGDLQFITQCVSDGCLMAVG